VKLKVCAIVDLIKVSGAKYGIFLLELVGHLTTRCGPDVARGPDVVYHCLNAFKTAYKNN